MECLKLSTNCAQGPRGPIGAWDIDAVTDMSDLFIINDIVESDSVDSNDYGPVSDPKPIPGADKFNGDLSKWDVVNVMNMNSMFQFAKSFNSDLSKWDVSAVTDMGSMFAEASSFNADLSKWDVSSVIDMESMFGDATSFNADLSLIHI